MNTFNDVWCSVACNGSGCNSVQCLVKWLKSLLPKPPAVLKLDSQGSVVPDKGQSGSAQPAEVTQPKATAKPEEEAHLKVKVAEEEAQLKAKVAESHALFQARLEAQVAAEAQQIKEALEAKASVTERARALVKDWAVAMNSAVLAGKDVG